MTSAFEQLDPRLQRWIGHKGWPDLRAIQKVAIPPILSANRDVIISASTASGKTEAAFLPALTVLAQRQGDGVGILYISPLKALINDQYRRIQELCTAVGTDATPWHGDVLASRKSALRKNPRGVLLITPESLEAMFLRRHVWCAGAFATLGHVIIDEFHAFLGTERGRQLLSLLHRMEFLLNKPFIPRVALSATLSDLGAVRRVLRSRGDIPCECIEERGGGKSTVKIQLRGFDFFQEQEETHPDDAIVDYLFEKLRDKSHLVFANNKKEVEHYSVALSDLCAENGITNRFFPHHGNLAKEHREWLEHRLAKNEHPTTAVCTSTMELGIDIGHVETVAQIGPPYSVSSIRQRLGRSGRGSGVSILRGFNIENEITTESGPETLLRLNTFQWLAIVKLFLERWYEPPEEGRHHFSTLVQQTLSVIGQYGGVPPDRLWSLLCCKDGPFPMVTPEQYKEFLRSLAEQDLIQLLGDGQLTLGKKGEKLTGHYNFYTAFTTVVEYRLEHNGRSIGSIYRVDGLKENDNIVLSGRRWIIESILADRHLIRVKPAKGGKPPVYGGSPTLVHDRIRREMRMLYADPGDLSFLDTVARRHVAEGARYFSELGLAESCFLQKGRSVLVLPWRGDRMIYALCGLLRIRRLNVAEKSGIVDISDIDVDGCMKVLRDIVSGDRLTANQLAKHVDRIENEKHDRYVPRSLLEHDYGARFLDVDGAYTWICELVGT